MKKPSKSDARSNARAEVRAEVRADFGNVNISNTKADQLRKVECKKTNLLVKVAMNNGGTSCISAIQQGNANMCARTNQRLARRIEDVERVKKEKRMAREEVC